MHHILITSVLRVSHPPSVFLTCTWHPSQMGDLNPYALDYPVCLSDEGKPGLKPQQARMLYATKPREVV